MFFIYVKSDRIVKSQKFNAKYVASPVIDGQRWQSYAELIS